MRLFWHAPDLEERDWLRYLFASLASEEAEDLELARIGDVGIHVVSTNVVSMRDLGTRLPAPASPGRHVLVHLSDEWFSGGYAAYRHFDTVIRTHQTHLADAPGILTIPLGYPNRVDASAELRVASERGQAWSFVGEMKASRHAMARAMSGIGPSTLVDTGDPSMRLSKPQFDALLADSSFSPCPMGNVVLETWRLYESLELAAIPLVERRMTLDYYGRLLGRDNPIPTFSSWSKAAQYCRQLLRRPAEMDTLQAGVVEWWSAHKAATRAAVHAHVTGPTSEAELRLFARSPSNRSAILFEALRLAELVRHQSASSLLRRALRPRAVIDRVARDSGRPRTEV